MYLDNLEGFALLKAVFLEPFKGGGGGGGGGGRGSSSRRKSREEQRNRPPSPYLPILAIFVVLYSFAYIYFTSSKTK
jgi:hypothetical protein